MVTTKEIELLLLVMGWKKLEEGESSFYISNSGKHSITLNPKYIRVHSPIDRSTEYLRLKEEPDLEEIKRRLIAVS